MAIIATDSGGGDFTPTPAGTHIAICDMVVDLGKQATTYLGAETVKHQIYIRWQIPAERAEWQDQDGTKKEGPAVIGKTYTLSLGKKANLRKDLEAWRTRPFTDDELHGFDVTKLLGVPATITVTHDAKDGKTYANIASVGAVPKGYPTPQIEGEGIIYDSDNLHNFSKLSKRMQERVTAQIEPTGKTDQNDPDQWRSGVREELDDEVPF